MIEVFVNGCLHIFFLCIRIFIASSSNIWFTWHFLLKFSQSFKRKATERRELCVCVLEIEILIFKNRKMKIIDFLNILIFKQNITQHNALYVLSCKIKTLYIYIYRGEFMRRKKKQNIIIQWCDREGRSTKKNKFDILNYLFF